MIRSLSSHVVSPFVRWSLLLSLSLGTLPAQQPTATVPAAPNATCPIMGKKVSLPLFVDTELGRIWVCCKPCFKKVLKDVPKAHQTAYPVVEAVANTVCPVSGEAIGEPKVEVTLQQKRFFVCCHGCVATARADAQVVLAKLAEPQLVDLGNDLCPISGAKTTANQFVVIAGHVVRLADGKAVEASKQDPEGTLAKAKKLAAEQPPKPKHVHQPAPKPDAPKAGEPKAGEPKPAEPKPTEPPAKESAKEGS
ncbi:MAG: hypothetical protein JNL12_19150 [Planctomycetes bacterium]|nr:hypothetical protein [Planctomycetota bacterium]